MTTIKWTDLDNAIIGVSSKGQMVYDIDLVIKELMRLYDWTEEEAMEWFDFNIDGSYVGEETPIHVHLMDKEEIEEWE